MVAKYKKIDLVLEIKASDVISRGLRVAKYKKIDWVSAMDESDPRLVELFALEIKAAELTRQISDIRAEWAKEVERLFSQNIHVDYNFDDILD